jgi:putative hydrolase of the HAD superfamily
MTRYDAAFFDLGGVVVDLKSIREGYALFVERLAAEYDLSNDALDRWKASLGSHFKRRDGTEYRTAREGYRVATAALFDGSPPPESDWRPVLERATAETSRPVDGAVETVRAVSALGVHVGVISDIDTAEAHDLLARFEINDCFDSVTTSEAVGHTKPDPRMYETALTAWGGAAGDAVMIGDRYRHDVAGAVDAGLDAVALGSDARGPKATHEIDDVRELVDIVRGE